jgi:hypothetical protein
MNDQKGDVTAGKDAARQRANAGLFRFRRKPAGLLSALTAKSKM